MEKQVKFAVYLHNSTHPQNQVLLLVQRYMKSSKS